MQQQSYHPQYASQGHGQAPTGAAGGASQTFQLSVACKKLANLDLMSKSDPLCVLYILRDGAWREVGKTERIKNNLNPNWQTKFTVDEVGGPGTRLKFEVYDWDDKSSKLKNQDFLAKLEVPLKDITSLPGMQYVTVIKDGPSKGGQFVIAAQKVTSDKRVVKVTLAGRSLDKKDTIGKSDPFFIISKMVGHGKLTPVQQSEVIKNNLNPTWNPFTMSTMKLCNGDMNCNIRIDVYDYDDKNSKDLIGGCNLTLKQLSEAKASNRTFPLINPKKQSKKGYRNSGEIHVIDFQMWQAPNFVDS